MENQQTQTWLEKATPFIAILSLQLGYAVMDVLSKAALNNGMSNYVFVVYRHAIAFIVITPFALYFEKYNPLYLSLPPSLPLTYNNKFLHIRLYKSQNSILEFFTYY
jgi:hypothetical protein